jgi:lysophospholipase L1-like esterase
MKQHNALILGIILLLSPWLSSISLLDERVTNEAAWNFIGGSNQSSLLPVQGDSATFQHLTGSRADNASVDFSFSPTMPWENSTVDLRNVAGWGTFENTTVSRNGIQLVNNVSNSYSPSPGTSNLTILNQTYMSGNHSYDVLYMGCGIVSCGSIIVNGSLTINANRIVVEVSTYIDASATWWGGTGVGGSQRQANNGLSSGAGGGGHNSSGGDGGYRTGGSSSNNGGSSYGNGSEAGSAGGNISSSSGNLVSTGGKGGGIINLFASSIYINGSIKAEGEDGDAGAVPSGGSGSGGSGAGGGSGGSILFQANIIAVGTTGQISVVGGNGGNGANGQCAPGTPCLFMYDGGHGGGGGSGGYIRILNSTGGYSSNGVISTAGGNAGSGGLAYGTGSAGNSGVNGGIGSLSVQGFGGYSGPDFLAYGTWTSETLYTNDIAIEDAYVNFSYSIPADTNIEFESRWSLDNQTWSDWIEGDINGTAGPRLVAYQFKLILSTEDNSSTPSLSSMFLFSRNWQPISNLQVSLEGTNVFGPITANIGATFSNNSYNTSNLNSITQEVPINGMAVGDGWYFIESFTSSSSENLRISLGGQELVNISENDFPPQGMDLKMPQSLLNANWPTSISATRNGIDYGLITLTFNSPSSHTSSMKWLSIPWSINFSVDIADAMDIHIISVCRDWYNATPTKIPGFSIEVQADGEDDSAILTLDNLDIDWVDDIAPVLKDVWFEVSGIRNSQTRQGATVDIAIQDWIAESNMQVDAWVLENPVAANLTSVVTLGSSTTAGAGASDSQTTAYVPLLEDWLQENNTQLSITNLGQGGARVTDYQAKMTQILAAQPEVVTFLPFGDYANTPVSQWWSDYVPLLEQIEETGAHILFFDLRIDPQYVCGNGSGPGGCYSATEAHGLNEKNDAMAAIAANLSNITLIPFSDTNAAHPEWNAMDGHPNDAGHTNIASQFISEFENLLINNWIPSQAPLSTYYDHTRNVHFSSFTTSDWDVDQEHTRFLSLRMTDNLGNSVFYGAASYIKVVPVLPIVENLMLSSENGFLDNNPLDSRWWHNQSILFDVEVVNDRTDLNTSIQLTSSQHTISIPLSWNESSTSYQNSWQTGRVNMGEWGVEVLCSDDLRNEEDENGMHEGDDASINIVDLQKPKITDVSGDWLDQSETTYRIIVEWSAELDESVIGSVFVSFEDGSHYRTLILTIDSQGVGYADLDLALMQPGTYYLDAAITDEDGNNAEEFTAAHDLTLLIHPPPDAPSIRFYDAQWQGWNLTWSGTLVNESDQPTTISLMLDDKSLDADLQWSGNEWTLTLDMRVWLLGQHNLSISSCDTENRCSTNVSSVDTFPILTLYASSSCSSSNEDANGTIQAVSCDLSNQGSWQTSTRVRLLSPAPGVQCIDEFELQSGAEISITACNLLEESEGEHNLNLLIEALDIRGEWVILSQDTFTLTRPVEKVDEEQQNEEDDSGETKTDIVESKSDSSSTTLWIGGVSILALIAISLLLKSRRGEEEETEEVYLWGMEEPMGVPEPIDQDIAKIMLEVDETPTMSTQSSAKVQWVKDWQSLPGGGEYSSTEEGQWYQDGEGDWWWSQPDGSWSRRS